METYAFDFETTYDTSAGLSIREMGVHRYARETDPFLVSIVGDDGLRFVGDPKDAPWSKIAKGQWVAHNLGFDGAIYLARKHEWSDPPLPRDWHDTAALAAFLQAPRNLKGAARALLGVEADKEVRDELDGKTRQDIYHNDDLLPDDTFADRLHAYCLADSELCLRLWTEFSDQWPQWEREVSRLTIAAGWVGLRIDLERANRDAETLRGVEFDAKRLIPWAGDNSDDKTLSPLACARECRKRGVQPPPNMAEDDPAYLKWEDNHGADAPFVKAMRQARKANTLVKKYDVMRNRVRDKDGCMGYDLMYFGAKHTGRWSGAGKFNMQNLPRQPFHGCDLRACFVPRPGKRFIIADLSQIEPRVLALLAGNNAFLDLARQGMDVYEAFARSTGQWTRDEPLATGDKPLRQVCKALVLGCGYGMSGPRFAQYAKMFGLDFTEQAAATAVADYRAKNPHIVNFWRGLDNLLKASVGDGAEIDLPSGRPLRYFEVREVEGKINGRVERNGAERRLWGSLVCENIIQGAARDVFADRMLALHKDPDMRAMGAIVLLHVHDEIILEVEAEHADAALARTIKIFSTAPAWAPTLPLAAEGGVATQYGK